MDMRARLRKAAGLFVTLPEESTESTEANASRPSRTVEELVRESEGPNLDEIEVADTSGVPWTANSSPLGFAEIYAQAGLPATPFTAEQMVEMLNSLPTELPLAMKRQTVNITLNAMGKSIGATPETVVSDASRKLAALTAYSDSLSGQTAHAVTTMEQEINVLQAEIEAKKQAILQAQNDLSDTLEKCHAESDRLDDVLEFFSLDVPPSRLSPPGN